MQTKTQKNKTRQKQKLKRQPSLKKILWHNIKTTLVTIFFDMKQ